MTPQQIERLEIRQNGVPAADMLRESGGARIRFRPEWTTSLARHLPISLHDKLLPGLANVPPFMANLAPEGILSDAVREKLRIGKDDFFSLLAATGFDAIGDITLHVPGGPDLELPGTFEEAGAGLRGLMSGRSLEASPSAIPGVQPKISIGSAAKAGRFKGHLIKMSPPYYDRLVENEALFMKLAKLVGIKAAGCQVHDQFLVVKRFDLTARGRLHVEDGLQILNLFPNSKYGREWVEIMDEAASLPLSSFDLARMIELYAYSWMVGNGDLHEKNVSFIYDREDGSWSLAPAYDLLSTLPYPERIVGHDAMALALQDEAKGRFEMEEFLELGRRYGINPAFLETRIRKMATGIGALLPKLNENGPLDQEVQETVLSRAKSMAR